MKRAFGVVFTLLVLFYNAPVIIIMGIISLWHWDKKYVDDFTSKVIESTAEHILD